MRFSLTDVSRRCGASVETVIAVVEEGLVQPHGVRPQEWWFDAPAVHRVRRALRLQRELDLELPAIALALNLFDEIERLRRRLAVLEYQLQLDRQR